MIERMASPLNAYTNSVIYFSQFKEDTTFGASSNAFSTPWIGLKQCNLENEHLEMERSLRWAIGSALHHLHIPTLTLLISPEWNSSCTAYHKWLAHPLVHEIIPVSKRYFKFQTPRYYTSNIQFHNTPNWNILFVMSLIH